MRRLARCRTVAALGVLGVVFGTATACATGAGSQARALHAARARDALAEGLAFYEADELALAARRFADAAHAASRADDSDLELRATTAECTSWLRARLRADLATCSTRLEALLRASRRPDPGVNTLIALGAIADGRPLPRLRIPQSVRPIVEAAAKETGE